MASKVMSLFRKRGLLLLVVSAVSAVLAAKSGGTGYGFWDGPI